MKWETLYVMVLVSEELLNQNAERVRVAKLSEVEKWIEEGVYEEVQDEGQEKVSTTWVITEKVKDNEILMKARLKQNTFMR